MSIINGRIVVAIRPFFYVDIFCACCKKVFFIKQRKSIIYFRDKVKKMKLLVISDSHRNIDNMQYATEHTKPDAIVHLGDHIDDAYELQRLLPGTMIHMVQGNCDFQSVAESELLLTFEGVTVYMTHGHIHDVKSGYDALVKRARQRRADLALFGHTHKAIIWEENGLWLMNPGQIGQHGNGCTASYGIVAIENGSFECNIIDFAG